MYITICQTDDQCKFDAWSRALKAGALRQPRGMRWGWRWKGVQDGGTHVHPWLIHVYVWQKPPQYCKVISFQLNNFFKARLSKTLPFFSFPFPPPLFLHTPSSSSLFLSFQQEPTLQTVFISLVETVKNKRNHRYWILQNRAIMIIKWDYIYYWSPLSQILLLTRICNPKVNTYGTSIVIHEHLQHNEKWVTPSTQTQLRTNKATLCLLIRALILKTSVFSGYT